MHSLPAERLQRHLEGLLQDPPLVGAAAAVVRGQELWRGSAGAAAAGAAEERPSPEGSFLVYSISKSFTTALILKLVAAGELDLDAFASEWLPGVNLAAGATIRQLLNHTSGIPDYGGLPEYHRAVKALPSEPWTFEQFVAHTSAAERIFTPGGGWAYSNTAYLFLRRLIENVTGETFERTMHHWIIAPLGLRSTSVAVSREDLMRLVPGHSRYLSGTDRTAADARTVYHPGWVATGVLASTAADIAQFYHDLFGGRVINSTLLGEMLTTVRVPTADSRLFTEPSYGLGHHGRSRIAVRADVRAHG